MTYIPYDPVSRTQFDEQRFAEQSQQINLKSIYGISALRDVTTETGSATVTNSGGEYKLTTTASGTDVAKLESAERGRYIAGQDAVAGMGVRVAATPTGNQDAKWGYFDANDGFGFGVDATGVYVFSRRGASDTKVYQSSWNADVLDGTGESGLTLDDSIGYIYQIQFSWYGYGTISYNIVMYDSDNKQTVVNVHKTRITSQTSVTDPNLPICMEIDNGGTASAFDSLYVGGRQFSTLGKFRPSKRITSQYRLGLGSVDTTFLPTVSLRRKSAFGSVSVKVEAADVITDADLLVQIRENGSLTSASYVTPTDHTAAETAVEADLSATAITGGEVIWEGLVNSSGLGPAAGGNREITISDVDLIGTQPVTVCVRRVTGTGATVSVVLRVTEEW